MFNAEELDAYRAGLVATGSVAEEALALHREALALVVEGWCGESGSAATDLMQRQCGEAADVVEALHGTAAELRSLRTALEQSIVPLADVFGGDAAFARLNERPVPRFETPAPPTLAYQPPPQFPVPSEIPPPQQNPAQAQNPTLPQNPAPPQPSVSWAPGIPSLPNLGGAFGGLAAQIAGGLAQAGSLAADAALAGAGGAEVNRADTSEPASAGKPAARTEKPEPKAVATPRTAPTTLIAPPVVRPEGVPAPQPEAPELPLLAAERPPEAGPAETAEPPPALTAAPPPAPADPVPDSRTPCEIAADELPQVGQ